MDLGRLRDAPDMLTPTVVDSSDLLAGTETNHGRPTAPASARGPLQLSGSWNWVSEGLTAGYYTLGPRLDGFYSMGPSPHDRSSADDIIWRNVDGTLSHWGSSSVPEQQCQAFI
jgi:hypothetical protein